MWDSALVNPSGRHVCHKLQAVLSVKLVIELLSSLRYDGLGNCSWHCRRRTIDALLVNTCRCRQFLCACDRLGCVLLGLAFSRARRFISLVSLLVSGKVCHCVKLLFTLGSK